MRHLGQRSSRLAASLAMLCALVGAASGCQAIVHRPEPRLVGVQTPPPYGACVPTEKDKSSLPPYTVEPPDILLVESIRLVPKPPYHIQSGDELQIIAEPQEANLQARGFFVDPQGRIDLGPRYGKVQVGGLTADEAEELVGQAVAARFNNPVVSLTLVQSQGMQPITGEHLVSPDGTVNLGTYGLVYVAGMTLPAAKQAIEEHLKAFLDQPQVAVSVFSYNSKVYYVITQGAGQGDQVTRLPITGNETVLDAIAQINGLSPLSSKHHIWIARPAESGAGCDVILPVSWSEITAGAATATNYQVLPGDRIFIAENKLIAADSLLSRITAPIERIFGTTLLTTQAIQNINRFPLGLSGFGGTGF
jgi:protein involved in polysaccharide export with SLBB domain